MKISNFALTNQYRYSQNFTGKGIDLIENWQEEPNRISWYNDVVQDLSEGSISYFKAHKEVDDSVIKFHESGGLSILFELQNNEVLKISLENPCEFREHNPEFDIPFLTPVEKWGKTFIVKQPKADTENVTVEHCREVGRKIQHNLCELSTDGWKAEQYGLYNGRPYLLDTRCAMPLPNLWSFFIDNLCKKLNKCYTVMTEEQRHAELLLDYEERGYFAYHCDETPRKNLTFGEGLAKLYKTIKTNYKYKKNHHHIPYVLGILKKMKLPYVCKFK